MAETVIKKVRILYTCPECGETNLDKKTWVPCNKYCAYVCGECCRECPYHVAWSGLHDCRYETDEKRLNDKIRNIKKTILRTERKLDTPSIYNNYSTYVQWLIRLEDAQKALAETEIRLGDAVAVQEAKWAKSPFIKNMSN